MKGNLILLAFFFCQLGIAQESQSKHHKPEDAKPIYYKFDLSTPLRLNQYAGQINPYTGENEPWLLPDGISARIGFGTHYDKWIGAAINTGIDWKANKCLVVAPIFGSIRLSPRITEEMRITLDVGYGRALALIGDHLSGNFKKISLGIESEESGLGLFIELCQYGFSKTSPEKIGSLSIGLNYVLF